MKFIKKTGHILLSIIIFVTFVSTFASCGNNNGVTPSEEIAKSYGYEGEVGGIDFVLNDLGTEVGFKNSTQRLFLEQLNKHKTDVGHDETDVYGNVSYYDEIRRYAGGISELSIPDPVVLTWSTTTDKWIDNYEVALYDSNNLSDILTIQTNEQSTEVYNLKTATVYIWNVTAIIDEERITSGEACFTTADEQPRNLYVDGVTNFRDLGGYKTEQGKRIKQGLIYRCAALNNKQNINITRDGLDTLMSQLGVKTEIDLREGEECGYISQGDLGVNMNYFRFPMGYDGNIISTNTEQIKRVFGVLAQERNYPLIFHCAIGTDRTGAVAFLINGLLGVSVNDLYLDYAWSNFGNIGGSRNPELVRDNYFNMIDWWYEGETFQDKVYNFLNKEIGIKTSDLDSIISILT